MTDDNHLEIIREVAREKGISPTILEKAWRHQFKVLKETIESATKNEVDTFKTVYIKYVGKFIPKRKNIIKMKEYAERRKREGKTDS